MIPVIHIITTISRGGAENQLLILAREQVMSGRKVSVIYLKDNPELKQDFEAVGVEIVESVANRPPLSQIFELRKIISNQNCIVHAHLPRAELLARISTRKQRLVISRHNAEAFFPGAPKVLSSFLSCFVTRRADISIMISKAVSDFVLKNHELPTDKIPIVIPYGFNKDRVLPSRNLNKDENSLILGTIARIVPQKDFPTLLRAFQIFQSEFSHSKLKIIGDGFLRDEMENLAKALNVNSSIEWLGRKSDIDKQLQTFDIFLLTSTYEGFGLVLLEAMANHVPILASDNSAIPEVLGQNSQSLFKTGNFEQLAEKLRGLISFETRHKLVQTQLTRLELFDATAMREKVDSVYQV
jgi:glycosyltransferase involved in cell wall biosynthesis